MKNFNEKVEGILRQFKNKFGNPIDKYLGNDFAEYPKANIKDAPDFIFQSLTQFAQEITADILVEEKELISGFFEKSILFENRWVTWEFFKDRYDIKEFGYIGDAINGDVVYNPKYDIFFKSQLFNHLQAIKAKRDKMLNLK